MSEPEEFLSFLSYTAILTREPDASAINVAVPALPGVLTWGKTPEEALASAREAIELHLEGKAPEPSRG